MKQVFAGSQKKSTKTLPLTVGGNNSKGGLFKKKSMLPSKNGKDEEAGKTKYDPSPPKAWTVGGHNSKSGIFKKTTKAVPPSNSGNNEDKAWWSSWWDSDTKEEDTVGSKQVSPMKSGANAVNPKDKNSIPKKNSNFSWPSKKANEKVNKGEPTPPKSLWPRLESDTVVSENTEEDSTGSKKQKKSAPKTKTKDVEATNGSYINEKKKNFLMPLKFGRSEEPETVKDDSETPKSWWPWGGSGDADSASTDSDDGAGARNKTSVACIAGAFFWGALLIAGIVTGAIYLSKSESLPPEPSMAPLTSWMPSNAPSTLHPSTAPSQLPSASPPPTPHPTNNPTPPPTPQPTPIPDPPRVMVVNGSKSGWGAFNWPGGSTTRDVGLQSFRLKFQGSHRSIKGVQAMLARDKAYTAFYSNNHNDKYTANVDGVLLPFSEWVRKRATLSGPRGCESYNVQPKQGYTAVLTGFQCIFTSGNQFIRKLQVSVRETRIKVCFHDMHYGHGSMEALVDYALVKDEKIVKTGEGVESARAKDIEFKIGDTNGDTHKYTSPVLTGFSLEFTDKGGGIFQEDGDDNTIQEISAGVFLSGDDIYGRATLTDGQVNRGIKAGLEYALVKS